MTGQFGHLLFMLIALVLKRFLVARVDLTQRLHVFILLRTVFLCGLIRLRTHFLQLGAEFFVLLLCRNIHGIGKDAGSESAGIRKRALPVREILRRRPRRRSSANRKPRHGVQFREFDCAVKIIGCHRLPRSLLLVIIHFIVPRNRHPCMKLYPFLCFLKKRIVGGPDDVPRYLYTDV